MKFLKMTICLLVFYMSSAQGQTTNKLERVRMPSLDAKKAEIQWLWKHLPFFVMKCVQDADVCQSDKKMLSEIGNYLLSSSSQIVFSDEKVLNLNFDLEQKNHRVALTQLTKNADIYINVNRMKNLSMSSWASLLVHESAHHLGYEDDNFGSLDLLGNRVAKYFLERSQETKIAGFGLDGSKILTFLSNDLELRSLLQISNPLDTFKPGETLSQDMSSLKALGQCAENKRLNVESIKSNGFNFRTLKYKNIGDRLRVVGSNIINYSCIGNGGVVSPRKLMLELSTLVNLSVDSSGEQVSRIDPIDLTFSVHDENSAKLELNSRIKIESVEYSSESVVPGDRLDVFVKVMVPSDVKIESCTGLYSGDEYSYHAINERLLFHEFDTCEIVSGPTGSGLYQLKLTLAVQNNFPSQKLHLDFIGFATESRAETAVSFDHKKVSLLNPLAPAPLKVVAYEIPGYRKTTFKNIPFQSAYKIKQGVPFDLNLIYTGEQKILNVFFESEIYADFQIGASGFLKVEMSGRGQLLKGHTVEVLQNNQKKLSLKLELPESLQGAHVLGFKLRKVIFQTNDSYFYELNTPSRLEFFFFTEDMEESL